MFFCLPSEKEILGTGFACKKTPYFQLLQGNTAFELVPLARLEHAARGLGNRCSIHLSYRGECFLLFEFTIYNLYFGLARNWIFRPWSRDTVRFCICLSYPG